MSAPRGPKISVSAVSLKFEAASINALAASSGVLKVLGLLTAAAGAVAFAFGG
jgi:hypothetical protein